MKKLVMVASFWLVSAGMLFAQTGGVVKFRTVPRDEVPVAVQNSLQNDFAVSVNDGSWSLQYTETGFGTDVLRKPVAYTFLKKEGKKKVRIQFSPTGALVHASGIEKKPAAVAAAN